MAPADHWFVDLKLCKVNFNDLIMQLKQIFGRSVVFSDFSYLKSLLNNCISTINWFISNQTQTMKIGPKSGFFLNISTLLKN